ncbi:hypothetical protein [Deinococcus altitudinis]|uniref:hypothetical protein n=1 Tax=Deinococcus altitudinis TaxID=468914 RepID=UPI00389250C3
MNSFQLGTASILLASLTACGSAAIPQAPAQAQVITAINGVLVDSAATTVTLPSAGKVLASAPSDAGGRFTLNLPNSAALASIQTPLSQGLLNDFGCSGTLAVADPGAQSFGVAMLQTPAARYMNATVVRTLLSRSLVGKAYLYVDRATTASGTLDCSAATGMPTRVDVALNVSAGWNVLAIYINGNIGLGGISVSGRLQNGGGPIDEVSSWTDEKSIQTQLAQ